MTFIYERKLETADTWEQVQANPDADGLVRITKPEGEGDWHYRVRPEATNDKEQA